MYSDHWYNDDPRDSGTRGENYWIALRSQVMNALIAAVDLDAEQRINLFHRKSVEDFDKARHFYGTIIQLAIDGDIIVPPNVDIGWDGDLMAVTSFARTF